MTKARSNATANAAKGDLTVGNGTNLSGVLGVGSNGETIVADNSTSTGLRYQPAFNGNAVINGAMDFWQRGTSFTGASAYTADRWQKGGAANYTVSRQASGLTGFTYCLRAQRNSGATTTNTTDIAQGFETETSLRFAGKAVAFSFWARAGANYSAASSVMFVRLIGGTGTDQSVFSGYTGSADQISTSVTLTTSWQRFTVTGTVSSNITELTPYFSFTPVGTAGAADFFEITGVQLELGSVASSFTRAGGTLQGELAACERYFQSFNASTNYSFYGVGSYNTTTLCYIALKTKTTMRTSPTAAFTAGSTFIVTSAGTGRAASAVTVDQLSPDFGGIYFSTAAATAGNSALVQSNNTTSSSIQLSAEL